MESFQHHIRRIELARLILTMLEGGNKKNINWKFMNKVNMETGYAQIKVQRSNLRDSLVALGVV